MAGEFSRSNHPVTWWSSIQHLDLELGHYVESAMAFEELLRWPGSLGPRHLLPVHDEKLHVDSQVQPLESVINVCL